ncbi:YdeI/OmpD-associated family protein [Knoellia subterranea]|uniref:2-isopropylmalate synthase n=1 Tax=Knoellia subterranea KCTC 19937 TaxID=1385521 RepID=A0A0A0JN81_9MICO|nr:YdeI/OmpD-associated family protein [Knoellia subterranea]KGN37066.1 2-isopropylmalate synthase [Knoellia subterranea KCTC 19937]
MGETLHLTAVLEPMGPAGGFSFTDEQVGALGDGAKTFPVVVTINGKAHALRLARMGGQNLVGFSKANRAAAGIELGDEVTFDISADSAPRTVEVPDDLAAALGTDPVVAQAFEGMAYSHRKEYVRWVTEAKREQTRADRIAKTVEMVRAGQPR